MKEIKINDELKNLLPPLSGEEFAGLEASILQYGCLTPIVTWNNMIVDGHYRYEICTKHCLAFATREMEFADLEAAKLWAWQHQENRRNLTPFYRAELALKFKNAIAMKAKARRQSDRQTEGAIPGSPVRTSVELAKLAGVSHDTLHRVEFISSFADEETKSRLRRGDKGTSINREYNRLKIENAVVPLVVTPAATPGPKICMDEESGTLFVRKDALPEELAAFIVEHFPLEYVRNLVREFMNEYERRYGGEATQHFLLDTCAAHID